MCVCVCYVFKLKVFALGNRDHVAHALFHAVEKLLCLAEVRHDNDACANILVGEAIWKRWAC